MNLLECHDDLVSRFESLGQGFSADFNLKLERIEHLLRLLGNPQNDYKVIHVAGTSGKGSVSTLTSQILTNSGFGVGLFTSPYLQVITESCQIDGQRIPVKFMSSLLDECWPAIQRVGDEGEFGAPSYSETLLAVSLLAFSRMKVDVAVVEAFLGGKLDATNVVNSEVAVLVSVGLDHVEILGTTIEEIASDKMQIIKPGKYAVCGFTQPSAQGLVREYADQVQAELVVIGEDFGYEYGRDGSVILSTLSHRYEIGNLPGEGQFRAHNLACAVAACEKIVELKEKDILLSLGSLNMPGRSEVLSYDPVVVIDGAHNPPKIQAALEAVGDLLKDKNLVVVYASKQAFKKGGYVQEFLDIRQREIYDLISEAGPAYVIFTEFKPKGIWFPEATNSLAAEFLPIAGRIEVLEIAQATDAYKRAVELAGKDGAVLVLGSFHLVAEVRDLFVSKDELLFEN